MRRLAFLTALILLLNVRLLYADSDYYIKVNRVTNCVTVYSADDTPVKAMICSVGANGATPTGTYSTSEKYRWRALFGNEYGQYCTRITGHILFHSAPYFSQNENDLNTENYNMLGEADSLGCIRLTAADAKWIYDNCPVGVSVTIFDGSEADDPLGKPTAIKLGSNAPYPTWDPTDPSEDNPYNGLGVKITSEKYVRAVYQNSYQTADELREYLKYGVKAFDTAGNEIDFSPETEADPSVSGVYNVTYTAEDALGRSGSLKTVFIVLPSELILNASLQ
ncbi:MAG: L,D-transpeptidase [Clostridiales bacterium]|nr:L,D-transpeptidase [Clostridiales bacterium]